MKTFCAEQEATADDESSSFVVSIINNIICKDGGNHRGDPQYLPGGPP